MANQEKIKQDFGSYNAWQTIINMNIVAHTPEIRVMSELALEELLAMQNRIKQLEAEVERLKPLAELGRYTEMAFEEEAIISFPDKTPMNCTKGVIGGIDLVNIEEFIQWGREQKDGGKVEG